MYTPFGNKKQKHEIIPQLRKPLLFLLISQVTFFYTSCTSNIATPIHEIINPIQTEIYTQLPTIITKQQTKTPNNSPTNTVTLTQTVTNVPYNWIYSGPDGDYIYNIAIDPISPSTLYTTTGHGTYKSTNGGLIWNIIDLIGACKIEIDPVTPSIIYASTKNGFFKSTDSGDKWNKIANLAGSCDYGDYFGINSFVVDGNNPSTIYLTTGSEVMKSTDGGENWISHDLNVNEGFTIAIDSFIPKAIYIGTNDSIIKSTDDGESWSEIKKFKNGNNYIIDIEIDPTTPTTIYASVFNYGLLKSTNGGETWRDIKQGLSGFHYSSIIINPNNPYILYAGSIYDGIFKSSNGGSTWYKLNFTINTDSIVTMAIDPKNNSTLYAGTYFGGVIKSTDSGKEWISINTGISQKLKVLYMAIDPSQPTIMYAGVEGMGLIQSKDGGKTWDYLSGVGSKTSFIDVDPKSPSVIYVEEWWIKKSKNAGKTWAIAGIHSDALRATTINSFAIDPTHPDVLYAGAGHLMDYEGGVVFKSTNGGVSWTPYHNGLPEYATIYALAIDPANPKTIYAGTFVGIYKSVDGGENWVESSISNIAVVSLAIDPVNPSILFAGTLNNGIIKSIDSGITWFPSNGDLPIDISIKKIIINPIEDNIIYMCTSEPSDTYISGIYKSIDGGGNWIYLGLGDVIITDLKVNSANTTIIYAATEKGIYFLE